MKAIKYELIKAPQKDSLILARVLDEINKEFHSSSELKCNRVSSESPHRTNRILKFVWSKIEIESKKTESVRDLPSVTKLKCKIKHSCTYKIRLVHSISEPKILIFNLILGF